MFLCLYVDVGTLIDAETLPLPAATVTTRVLLVALRGNCVVVGSVSCERLTPGRFYRSKQRPARRELPRLVPHTRVEQVGACALFCLFLRFRFRFRIAALLLLQPLLLLLPLALILSYILVLVIQ